MGTRAQIGIRNHDGGTVWLYTHGDGDDTPAFLARALSRRKRWNDEQYLARIIWDAMVAKDKHGWETGAGISTWPVSDANCPFLVVDVARQRVTMHASDDPQGPAVRTWTFEEFVATGASAFEAMP